MINENDEILYIDYDEDRIIKLKKIDLNILENNTIIVNNKYNFKSIIPSIYKIIYSELFFK